MRTPYAREKRGAIDTTGEPAKEKQVVWVCPTWDGRWLVRAVRPNGDTAWASETYSLRESAERAARAICGATYEAVNP